jgi:hypothetical protein
MKLKEKSKISSKNGDKTKNKDDSEAKNKKTTFNAKIIDFFKNPTNCIGSFGGLALMCGAGATTLRYLG